MPLLLRNIRQGKGRPKLLDLYPITRKELEKALDSEVKPALIKSHQLIVADWQHKPEFRTRKDIKSDRISMTVFPVGPNALIYKFVDLGTKPHIITPVKAPKLVFQLGYKSKTLARPARTVSGGGVATGPVMRALKVQHPGTEAREFSKTIAGDIKPDFNRIIDNTFRRVSRQLEE